MKKYIVLLISALVLVASCSKLNLAYKYYINPCYYDSAVKQKDFPQHFIEIELKDYYNQVISLSDLLIIDTLVSIEYKEFSYPVLGITKNAANANKRLLILAGVHGNESGGTLAILELLSNLNNNPSRYKDWTMKIVTPINPAGIVEMSRYNECGCDLNRKVKSSNQKGIVIQRKVIEEFKPEIIITLHEAPSKGFLIHPGKYLDSNLRNEILQDIETQGIELATKDYFGKDLTPPGISEVRGIMKFLKKVVRVQSLGDYLAERGIIEITTESGWNSQDTFQRVNSHSLLIASVIDNYEKNTTTSNK